MKSILFKAFILVANIYYAQNSYKAVEGLVMDSLRNQLLDHATIKLTSKNSTYTTYTDSLGRFKFVDASNGAYSLMIQHEGSLRFIKDSVLLDSNSKFTLNLALNLIHFDFSKLITDRCDVILVRIPLPRPLPPLANPTLFYEEIQQSVNKFQLVDLLQGISSNVIENGGNDLSIAGTRPNDYLFTIDGVKCRELHQIPAASMKSVTVMSHFIPANYGDTTGGVVLIETMSCMDLYYERQRRLGF